MKIIICLDNDNGMMFNNRRQSQDFYLRKDIQKMIKNSTLYMNEYSYSLFKDIDNGNIIVSDNFLECSNINDYCLVENKKLNKYIINIDTIIIYKWNRLYPSDFKFDITLDNKEWELISETKFVGYSHDNIIKIIYRRKKTYEK